MPLVWCGLGCPPVSLGMVKARSAQVAHSDLTATPVDFKLGRAVTITSSYPLQNTSRFLVPVTYLVNGQPRAVQFSFLEPFATPR